MNEYDVDELDADDKQQWPGLGQDGNNGNACDGHGKRRFEGRERRTRDSPRELTWEERIRKGAVQKERVEQRGFNRSDRSGRDGRENNSSSGRQKARRRERLESRTGEIYAKDSVLSTTLGERCPTANRNYRDQPSRSFGPRGSCPANKLCTFDVRTRTVDVPASVHYGHGIPLLVSRNTYYPSPPNSLMCVPRQHQRFRNTWLDASFGINYPSIPMMDYNFTPCQGYGGLRFASGHRYQYGKNPAREIAKMRVQLTSAIRAGTYEPGVVKNERVSNEDEEVWETETEDEKRKRWNVQKERTEGSPPNIEECTKGKKIKSLEPEGDKLKVIASG
ncbi:hypothetical protein RB195_023777 [Necator americanus]|uniref:Uncharacterized protein n=1 Tax=Necator americanus TaxID=51031 RepID=A0ABR1EL10_NECAM